MSGTPEYGISWDRFGFSELSVPATVWVVAMLAMETRAQHPFRFVTQFDLVEVTGLRAHTLAELLTHLKSAPGSVFYYHTHHFLKQHQFLSPEPPNDFAYWVSHVLQEHRLGEQLAAIDTVRFSTIRELADKIVEVIERYLSKNVVTSKAWDGAEFHLMKSQSFVLPTSYQASTLSEFIEGIKKIGSLSLYHHIFQARLRVGKESNDLSKWLESELGEKSLAKAISKLDPYTQTLESLRERILFFATSRLKTLQPNGAIGAAH